MSNRLQGITVEIDGNVTNLKSALKSVDSSLAETGRALRDINKLLKFDTNNTDLNSQKFEKLTKAVDETNARLEILKKAQASAEKEMNEGVEGGKEKYETITREIIETQNALNKLEAQQKKYTDELKRSEILAKSSLDKLKEDFTAIGNSLQTAGKSIETVGNNITGIGRSLLPLSALLVTGGKKSIDYAKTLDQAFDLVISKTGATGKAAEEYRDTVKKVFSETEFDVNSAAEAIGAVGVRFKDLSSGELEQLSTDFLKFAKITGTDVTTAVEKTARIMSANKIETKDYKKVLDQLSFTTQKTGINAETLVNSLDKYGAAFRNAGFNTNEAIALLGQFEAKGVDVNKALMALQTGGGRALKELGSAKEKILPLFEQLSKGELTTKEVQNAMETLGVRGGGALIDAFTNCGLSYKDFATVIESTDVAGTLDETYSETINGTEELKQKFDNLKTSFAKLGETLMNGGLNEALDNLAKIVEKVATAFEKLPEDKQQGLVNTLMGLAVAAPLLMGIGKVVTAIGGLVTKLGELFTLLGGGGALGTVGAVILAIAGSFVYLYNRVTGFADTVQNNFKIITESAKKLYEGVVERLDPLKEAFGNFVSFIEAFFSPVIGIAVASWTFALNTISSVFSTFVDVILGALDIFIGVFTGDWDRAWNGVKNIFKGIIDGIIGVFSGFEDGIIKGFLSVYENIRKAAAVIGIELPEITHTVEDSVGGMTEAIKKSGNEMVASAESAGNDMATGYQSAENFSTSGIESKFKNVNSNTYTWGKDAGNQWANGLNSSRLKSAVSNMAQYIKDNIGFSVPKEGPLSNADTYMPDMIDLFVKGIKDNQNKVFNAIQGLAGNMNNSFDTMQGVMATAGGTNSYSLPPMNIYIGNREIKDYAISASNDYVNDTTKAQNMAWGRL